MASYVIALSEGTINRLSLERDSHGLASFQLHEKGIVVDEFLYGALDLARRNGQTWDSVVTSALTEGCGLAMRSHLLTGI